MSTSIPIRLASQVPFDHGQAVRHRATRSLFVALCAAALAACGDSTGPAPDSMTVRVVGSTIINGVYDLRASVTDFDPGWGYDMTGYQYTATLRFEEDARFPGIVGTFSDLRATGPDVEPRAPMGGVITTSTARGGRLVIELKVKEDVTSFRLTLVPNGNLLGPVMQGWFGCCGHIGGPFTATRRGAGVGPPAAPTPGYHIYLANPSGVDLRQLARGHRPTWSPDGSRIAFEGIRDSDGTFSGIHIMDVSGTAERRLNGGEGSLPRWSPDGSKIAFLTCIPNGGNGLFPEIMCDATFGVINADGSGKIMLGQTDFLGTIPPAEWSPDGKKIAFVGGEGSRADLYVSNADGSGLAQLTRLGTVTGTKWSPDGRMLAFRAAGSVYVINADGSDLTQLTSATHSLVVRHLEWSPQGDRIAFSLSLDPSVWETKDPESLTVHVMNADGTNRIIVATNARDPRWLRDGRTLSFGRWFVDEIWTVSADGGEPSLLVPDGFGAEWSPDGTRIAYVKHHR
jgi:Tol biopolymer transport system component